MPEAQDARQAPEAASGGSRKVAEGDFWNRLGTVSSLATPIVVVFIGYFLSGKVDLALKARELELSNIKEMQPLVAQIETAKTRQDARAGSAALSAFGTFAIPPLLLMLRSDSTNVSTAAEEGLLNVGAAQPEPVCRQLHLILANRTKLYSWENQAAALRLTGQLGCENGNADVRSFSQMLSTSGLEQYKVYVKDDPAPDNSSLDRLNCQMKLTLSQLSGSRPTGCV